MNWISKIVDVTLGLCGADSSASDVDDKFPPVPSWQPDFSVSLEEVMDRMVYYTDDKKDVAIFENGTAVILPDGLADAEAEAFAVEVLKKIPNYHVDMNPVPMDDGNILVQYNHPVCNVVISEFADQNMAAIKQKHLDGLARDEVLITPQGPNKFDEFGMKALYGRTFMFMDAQNPSLADIYRWKSDE